MKLYNYCCVLLLFRVVEPFKRIHLSGLRKCKIVNRNIPLQLIINEKSESNIEFLELDLFSKSNSVSNETRNKSNQKNTKSFSIESYIVLSLLFFVTALCSLDRVAMSVAVIPMGIELHYTEEIKGAISTMFSFGYLFGMIPAGILSSFLSPKNVLSLGVLLWSIAQIVSPLAAQLSLSTLYITRFLMGASEAVTIPTVQNFVSRFVPEEKKSVVLGIVLSGLQVGNVGAFLVSPFLLDSFGWTGVLIAYGLMGFLWLAFWLPFAQDKPNAIDPKSTTATSSYSKVITEDPMASITSFQNSVSQVPFNQMIQSKEIQAIAVAHAVQNFGLYINLAWLPTYFNQQYGLSVDDSSLSSVLPWVAGAVVGPLSGALADKLITSGVDKTLVRKLSQTFALIMPAIALLTLSMAPADLTKESAIGLFVLAVASAAVCVAGFGSSVQDVCSSSKYVSIVYSITSAPAVLLGSTGVYLTGVLLDNTHFV